MSSPPFFRIVSLPFSVVDEARRTLRDALGHRLRVMNNPAPGNPCRFTLRQSPVGEELILMSYSPFTLHPPCRETGPIFIRSRGDEGYGDVHRFPPEIDPVTRVFRCYNAREEIVGACVGTPDPQALIAKLFSNPEVACIHARALTCGCFTFRIERA